VKDQPRLSLNYQLNKTLRGKVHGVVAARRPDFIYRPSFTLFSATYLLPRCWKTSKWVDDVDMCCAPSPKRCRHRLMECRAVQKLKSAPVNIMSGKSMKPVDTQVM
jgi:hypothetical protein